jgi:drug/metabolite transporter (DMT)-like permease
MSAAAPPSADARAARLRATLVGMGAVALWSTLALFATLAGPVPPFLLTGISFAIAAAVGFAAIAAGGRPVAGALPRRPAAWALGIAGLFGYHALYFVAVQNAPPVEANLVNYLWPLLIVVFAGLLPGERLGAPQIGGALLGLAGTALLVTGGQGLTVRAEYLGGYAAAVGCAVAWAGYSVLSRRFGDVPTDAVAGFCAATSVLALACHALFETTVWPDGPVAWLAVLALGLGPVGAAFFLWDHGVKRGDIQVLGASAYAAPLASTLILVAAGLAEPRWTVWAACVLIVGGAVLAGSGLLRRR